MEVVSNAASHQSSFYSSFKFWTTMGYWRHRCSVCQLLNPKTTPSTFSYTKGSPQLPDLQTKGDCSRYEEEDDGLKSPDQQFIIYVSLTEVEQSTVNMEITESNLHQQSSQLEQQHEEDKEGKSFKIDWKRVATTSMFGFAFVGPVGHFWYEGLEHVTRHSLRLRPSSWQFVTAKLAADSLLFGPVHLLTFFTYMGLASGKTFDEVKRDVKRDFLPAFMTEGCVWPIVQAVNFRFVPVRYQLLYVNFFCLLDSAFLSWFEQQDNAPWKKRLKSIISAKA